MPRSLHRTRVTLLVSVLIFTHSLHANDKETETADAEATINVESLQRGMEKLKAVGAKLVGVDLTSANEGKLEGTRWSSVETTIEGQKLPAGALSLDFTKDGKVTYKAGPMVWTGKFELRGGNKVALKMDQEIEGRKEHVETITIKDGKLTMTDSDGTSLTFSDARKKEKASDPEEE